MWTPEQRALSARYCDPVTAWKEAALECARLAAREQQAAAQPFIQVRPTLGLLVVVSLTQLVALYHGSDAVRATALALPLALLVQELPRAWFARTLGRSSKVSLSASGGHTELCGAPLTGAARLAFMTVGSVVNLGLAVAIGWFAERLSGTDWARPLTILASCQAAWGLGQALPIIPFRTGGTLARRLRPALRVSHAALSVVAVTIVATLLSSSTWAFAVFPVLALAAFAAWQNLGEVCRQRRDECSGAAALARQAADHVGRDDPARAIAAAEQGLALAESPELRSRLSQTLAWAAIGKADPLLAHQALERLQPANMSPHLVAAYLSCCNRLDEASRLLEQARAHGHRTAETTKLAVDVLYRSGKRAAARELACADRQLLSADDWRAIELALAE